MALSACRESMIVLWASIGELKEGIRKFKSGEKSVLNPMSQKYYVVPVPHNLRY